MTSIITYISKGILSKLNIFLHLLTCITRFKYSRVSQPETATSAFTNVLLTPRVPCLGSCVFPVLKQLKQWYVRNHFQKSNNHGNVFTH